MSSEQFKPGPDGEVLRHSYPDLEEPMRPYTMVSYGLPFDKACKKHVDGFLNASRVYIMASKSLATQTQCLARLEAALGEKHAGTWIGVKPHSPYDGLVEIMQDARAKKADCIVTLGGGSLSDGAKLIVYMMENGVENVDDVIELSKPFIKLTPETLAGVGKTPSIPIVFMPTTLSGGEYSKFAGCTNPRNHMKVQFTHPGMFARLVILDPDLCRTTPDWVWRSTGVRAIDHCVEGLCAINARPETNLVAERSLKRLVHSLLLYAANPDDLAARLEAQLGCNDVMIGLVYLINAGASHGIGHNLGPFGVGHGQTSCILLPNVMKYNARVNGETQAKIKEILWNETDIAAVLTKHGLVKETSDVGDALRAIFNELGMPKSLKEVNVGRDKWDQLAENSLADKFCKTNPVPLKTKEQIMEILEMCSGE
ncbi:Dehydroquinate synthase-like protein [Xylariaceae sp. FL0255]|nr:Dehydroquinate synthase-like protein [Xylariaceae sp. FL0255]